MTRRFSAPHRFRDLSIRGKVMCVSCLASLAGILTVAGGLYIFQLRHFNQTFTSELQTLAAIMADNTAAALAFSDPKTASEVMNSLHAKADIKNAAVLDKAGKLFAIYGADDDCPLPKPNDPAGVVDHGESWTMVQPIMLDSERIGTFVIDADYAGPRGALQRLYFGITGTVLGGSVVLVLLLSVALQDLIARPIRLLASASEAVASSHDYSVRVESPGNDELGQLTVAFNGMLARIQEQGSALRESRERYEMAVRGSSDGIWDWDIARGTVYFSPRWKEMLGYRDDELASDFAAWAGLLHPADTASTRRILDSYLAGERAAYEAEFRMRCKDESYKWILARGVALRDADGQPTRMAGSQTDITERKRVEEELRVAELKFRGLVEQLPAITYHAGLGEVCAWTYVSPQVQTFLGFTPEEWLASDKLWFEHIHPDDRGIPIEAEATAVRTGSFSAEYRMFTRGGELRWFRDQAVYVPAMAHAKEALYGVMMDITEAKAAEACLADLNKQLVESSRMAGMAEVATGVLHNVGNVLNSVNISASLTLEKLRTSKVGGLAKAAVLLAERGHDLGAFFTTDPQGQRLPAYLQRLAGVLTEENAAAVAELEQIGRNIEHIKEIVAMQQSYARITGVLEDMPPERLVEDALQLNAASFAKHGIEIVRDFRPASPVRVDKHKVLQILINLLRNAKHAVEDSKRPDPRIAVTIDAAGGRSRIAVTDNGVGIASENLTHIFRHGFTTKKNGHGFGLHSGANAAKEMGGALNVRSDGPGHGATFVLELPPAIGAGANRRNAELVS